MDSSHPLNVAIVGAGLGGLSAAIALRRSGHRVQVFEASRKNAEIGAGVGVQVNAQRILKQWGFSRENLKPVDFDGAVVFDAKSGIGITRPWLYLRPDEPHSVTCHRGDLHDELKRLAIGEGEGLPVHILLNTKVVACDPAAGTVTLSSGEVIHTDVVIGADGICSVVRTSIVGHAVTAPASGWTSFRCLLDASKLNEIPDLQWFKEGLSGPRSVTMTEQTLRMLFVYPCRSGTLINFTGIYPDTKQDAPDWTQSATLEEVREMYNDFNPKFLRILDLPLYSPILKWKLKALPALPTWTRGRTALLGDAAHATFPMLGQGAAVAIEEAGVLGCLLPLGTTKDDVPARLEAYQKLRKERGDFVGAESVAQAAVPLKRGLYLRSREMQVSMFDHDAIDIAREYFAAHFGGGRKS
ncbi:hypothetical protein B0H12DRAFT_1143088 [Mycena haematopus]|nr:hypothetical protein B0H12DRAFT_1143088 [Mycena haematopus]